MQIFYSLVAAFFVVFIAYMISHAKNDTKKKREMALEEAIRAGRTANAVLVKRRATRKKIPGTHEFWSSIGYYKYECKGKSYTYKYWADNPPATLKLYYIKNPAKATVAGALSPVTTNWPLVFIIVAAVLYFLIFR